MNENDIKKNLKKLKEIDELLNDDENVDLSIFGEIENIIKDLNGEVKSEVGHNYKLNVKFKKLSPNAITPSYAKDGDAGLDITATKIISETDTQITYGTDIALEIPYGYVGYLFPRSSIRKYNLSLSNSVGTIDAGYRGELMCVFNKTKTENCVKYDIGDKIVQMTILPFPKIELIESDVLSDSERGNGGFGSSGK